MQFKYNKTWKSGRLKNNKLLEGNRNLNIKQFIFSVGGT